VQVFLLRLLYLYDAIKSENTKGRILVYATQPPTQKEGAGGFFSITKGAKV